jgi:hypothetical protein
MRKIGALIAIAAGICGVLAAIITLIVAGAFADRVPLFALLEWRGVAFSFLTIVLGAICLCTPSKRPALLLAANALAGAVLNGTLVSFWMGIALAGGFLAALSRESAQLLC